MMSLLGFVIPWWGRWAALAALFAAEAAYVGLKVHAHDQEQFDAYTAQVKAVGDAQNAIAREKEITWKKVVEATENEAKLRTDNLNAQLAAAGLRNAALAGRRLVPTAPGPAAGRSQLCYSAGQLDRELREALRILYREVTGLAEEGQRARDLAAECVAYVKATR